MTAIFKYLPRITSDNGLSRYLQEIRKYPLLEPKYERALAMKWAKKKDIESDNLLKTTCRHKIIFMLSKIEYGVDLDNIIEIINECAKINNSLVTQLNCK